MYQISKITQTCFILIEQLWDTIIMIIQINELKCPANAPWVHNLSTKKHISILHKSKGNKRSSIKGMWHKQYCQSSNWKKTRCFTLQREWGWCLCDAIRVLTFSIGKLSDASSIFKKISANSSTKSLLGLS